MFSELQKRIYIRLLEEAKKKKSSKRGSEPEEGYRQATEDNLYLNLDNDGVIDPIDKENIKRFLKGLKLIP